MEAMTDRRLVCIKEACTIAGVTRRTIYNWIAGRKIEYLRTAGGAVRIYADTLLREPRPNDWMGDPQ